MRINIQCRCCVGMSHKVLQNFDIHFLFYHFSTGTSDWIETMNETIKHDIIKPTNKGGKKNWSRERLLTLSTAVVKRRQDEKNFLRSWMKLFHGMNWGRYIEHRKSSICSKVKHVFQIIKCQFGYRKVVYRGLKKNENRLYALFACANLYSPAIAGWKLSTI